MARTRATAMWTGALVALLVGRASANAQPIPPPSTAVTATEISVAADALDAVHRSSICSRRAVQRAILVGGLASIGAGAALMVPDGDDLAWRFAGINTLVFGVVNTLVAIRALLGIAAEERAWEAERARAERRTAHGLARARRHAIADERRESVGHAINLGLDFAYAGIGGALVMASQLGVEHPDRWLASGVAVIIEAAYLGVLDLVGLLRSGSFFDRFLREIAPNLSVAQLDARTVASFGVAGSF